MRSRVHEHLGGRGIVLGEARTPGAAVDEHLDRRVRRLGGVEIEPLDRCRAVSQPLGRPNTRTHRLAVGHVAAGDLALVRRIDALVVGVIEFLLVQVEPDQRPLHARRRSRLRERRVSRHHCRACEQGSSC